VLTQVTALLAAYAGLFLWSFLAATLLPLGSEAALALLVRAERRVALPVLVATAGNYLGACTTYWLGRRAARAVEARRKTANAGEKRALRWVARYGQPVLLLSWVPVVGDALVAVAGAMRLPFGVFSAWVAVGKLLRYLAVAWAASAL
jgi:membrane protein YqaA with SNARE-associated domain